MGDDEHVEGGVEVYVSAWWAELIHTQCLDFRLSSVAPKYSYTRWWAWTLTPPVIPAGGAW
jgi:hypothetical protein